MKSQTETKTKETEYRKRGPPEKGQKVKKKMRNNRFNSNV